MTREIQSGFEDKSLVIADGHHRYETALAFRDEIRAQATEWSGEEGYNYMMMNLVRMESPGLVVLAIHRLLNGLSADRITRVVNQLPDIFQRDDAQKPGASFSKIFMRLPVDALHLVCIRVMDMFRLLAPRIDEKTNHLLLKAA